MPSCTTYHNDATRSGWFVGTTRGVAAVATWRKYLDVSLGAVVRAAPLLLEDWTIQGGPNNGQTHDLLFVATSNNLVNAYPIDQLRAGSTNPLWSTQLPKALRRAGSNIPFPLGVCGTPVIDEANGQMHVLALQDDGGASLRWDLCSNTNGGFGGPQFGQNIADGRPFWAADFRGSGNAEILFYTPFDGNWWLGDFVSFIEWSFAGNTLGRNPGDPNFGQIWDGRPFWIADFAVLGQAQVLFYTPNDGNWWLAKYNLERGKLDWSLAGNTLGKINGQPNFGNVADGHHHFWVGNFTGSNQEELLFYFEGDGNWLWSIGARAVPRVLSKHR